MSNRDRVLHREGVRERACGQDSKASVVDRFGVWLSARRIRRCTGSLVGKRLADFGCSYHATFVRSVLPELGHAVLVGFALSPELKSLPTVTAIEAILPGGSGKIPSASLDIIVCISVLEHLWDPLTMVQVCLRIVCHGGVCLFNVPSWRCKRFL